MTRWAAGSAALFAAVGLAHGHFLFLTPPAGEGEPVRVVWAAGPTPDPDVGLDPFAGMPLAVTGRDGQVRELKPGPGGDGWLSVAGANDAHEVRGSVEYGVVVRGQPEPALVVFHAKWLREVGDGKPTLPADLSPVKGENGIAFVVTSNGRPVVGADVTVQVPGEAKPRVVTTDARGQTPAFAAAGRYAARAAVPEATAGEFRSKPYRQVRHYTTVVVGK